jgi:hypothetical protein
LKRAILCSVRYVVALSGVVVVSHTVALGQSAGSGDVGGERPVYQRHAFEDQHGRGRHKGHHNRRPHWQPPQVNAGWFQRPYPYHLDYYKMRYGGSYAPYFGNLYGTPEVVTAPPYYGPYYGNVGYGGYEGGPVGYGAPQYPIQNGAPPNGPFSDDAAAQSAPAANDELPAP